MKRQTFFPLGVLITVLLALAACRPGGPKATFTPAPTYTATMLPAPSQTSTPARQPTMTKRPTQPTKTLPLPSSTHTPLITSLFVSGIDGPHSFQTSTPIATPGDSPENFTLKAWSEADAIALIQALDEYAHANDLCFPAGCMRLDFVAFQMPIQLALDETLWRFPDTPNLDQYQWRLALGNAIQEDHSSDEWLLNKVEELLNSTGLPIEELNNYVKPHGFALITPYRQWDKNHPEVFPNLFGDQTNATIYQLTTLGLSDDGLFFAIRTDTSGRQKLIPIYSDWNFFTAGYYIADFSDHNLNGIPEITIYLGKHSGSMCSGKVLVFEWQGEHFIQRVDSNTSIEINMWDCSDWGYTESKDGAIGRIYVNDSFTAHTDYFKWDGLYYRFDERVYNIKTGQTLAFELNAKDLQPSNAIGILSESLPELQNEDSEYGPSTWDYMRFQLGLFYAIQSMPNEAKAQFESIANTPTNPSIKAIPQAAQAFLSQYTNNANVYRACNAALDVMQTALTPFRDADGNVTEQQMLQAWGYTDAWPLYPLCNLDRVLPYITWQLDANQTADVPAAMREAGVLVEYSAHIDLDGDGDQDWIEVVTKPSATGRSDATVWVLVQEPPGFVALRVSDDHDDIDLASGRETFTVETATLPDGKPVIVVRSGNSLFTFLVLPSDDSGPYIQDLSGYWWEVTDYVLEKSPYGPRITVMFANPDDKNTSVTESYLWDGEDYRFNHEGDALKAIAEQATQSLWETGKAAEAIPVLEAIVHYAPPACDENYPEGCDQLMAERSRYHYLLALAYELISNEAAAVQTYWQLWHDFPHSPYALMTRAKLEER